MTAKIYDHSDTGNAELLNELHGRSVRYDTVTQRWYQWTDGHTHWDELVEGEQRQLAISTAAERFRRGATLDTEKAKLEASFAIQSRNMYRQNAMLTIARGLHPIGEQHDWDSNPSALSCANGVIDLRTGRLEKGYRSDYITKGTSVEYNPAAQSPRWLQFIEEVTCGRRDIAEFLQRAVGYTLTGRISEEVFFLLYGNGRNGKGKFLTVVETLLGGLARSIRFEAFEENPRGDAVRDLAELPGIRMALANEGAEAKSFNTAVIKNVTGGDTITVSRKYGHPFQYRPQFKLWMTTNTLASVRDHSPAFWNRIILVPFEAQFLGASQDTHLIEKLLAELPGILAWAVQGAVIWHQMGISTPDILLAHTAAYKEQSDELSDFNCMYISDPASKTSSELLWTVYLKWAKDTGRMPLARNNFGSRMSQKFNRRHYRDGWYYEGVSLDVDGITRKHL